MVKVKSCYPYGDTRVEIELTNGQRFTVITDDNGIVKLLAHSPGALGAKPRTGYGERYPTNSIEIEYYGHPFED